MSLSRGWPFQCQCCGKKFRSYAAEAVHRHNFPLFCNRKTKQWKQFQRELAKRDRDKQETQA